MTATLTGLLLQLSEAGEPAILWGRQAARYSGSQFERLLDRGVLVEQAPATEWEVCAACDCDLDARRIEWTGGHFVAVCPTDRRSDLVLDDNDLRSFRVHPLALAREIAAASGFGDEPSPIAPGVWHLGETSSQRSLFLALSRDAVLQPGIIGLMRAVAQSLPITLISPEVTADDQARFFDASISVVAIRDCLGVDGEAVNFAIDHAALDSSTAFDPQLVIFRQSQRVTMCGDAISLPQQPFKLLVRLAEIAGSRKGYLTPNEIEAENSGRSAADLVRDLRDFLSKGQRDRGKDLIKMRRSPTRYFLALPPDAFKLKP